MSSVCPGSASGPPPGKTPHLGGVRELPRQILQQSQLVPVSVGE